jgi:NIMA (never in mitosis gene a)-related kinase
MTNYLILDDCQVQSTLNIGSKLEDFEILQTLGKGGYGFVAKVKSKINHKLYAMKMIDFSLIKDKTEVNLSLNEIKIIQNLNSPHIIKYYNNFQIQNRLYIIMEFMNNGDLKGYIDAHKNMNNPIPEPELWQLFYQCAAGLTYIHKNNLIHRDIKPANLFMTDDKAIKIGDFGVSATKSKQNMNNLMIGTPNYMSPEMFNQSGYGNKVDVYALGVSFHVMCYYDLPRKIVTKEGPKGVTCDWEDIPPTNNINCYSPQVNNIIQKMIEKDQNKRPSSFEILEEIKKIYNNIYRQNYSIDNAYRCLFSFSILTNYMIKNRNNINQKGAPKPICSSFLFAIDNLDSLTWPSTLVHLRNCLTFENSCFPDPGLIEPIDLIKFILRRIHKESLVKGVNNPPEFFTNPDNNQTIFNHQLALQAYSLCLNNYKSCISDCFFGTYEITKFCTVCQKKKFYFQNFYEITFDIDEALKNGISGNNGFLLNYFFKQNMITITKNCFCCFCGKITLHQECKKVFSFPFNLIICFKGEKDNYNNQYLQYTLQLDLSKLGQAGITKYKLNGIIKSYMIEDKKICTCFYFDYLKGKWTMSDGYTKEFIDSPMKYNVGDIVMLFYSSY